MILHYVYIGICLPIKNKFDLIALSSCSCFFFVMNHHQCIDWTVDMQDVNCIKEVIDHERLYSTLSISYPWFIKTENTSSIITQCIHAFDGKVCFGYNGISIRTSTSIIMCVYCHLCTYSQLITAGSVKLASDMSDFMYATFSRTV